jgi:hypothetical protein
MKRPISLLSYWIILVDERYKLFRIDAIKAFIYVAIAAAALFLSLKKSLIRILLY